jgi:hypothetical protein
LSTSAPRTSGPVSPGMHLPRLSMTAFSLRWFTNTLRSAVNRVVVVGLAVAGPQISSVAVVLLRGLRHLNSKILR